jgi:hypothetical protein
MTTNLWIIAGRFFLLGLVASSLPAFVMSIHSVIEYSYMYNEWRTKLKELAFFWFVLAFWPMAFVLCVLSWIAA